MQVLKCRNCGGDVASNEKARKCRHCSELFPFECAVCSRHLRPPLPDYPVERFFNDLGAPLCEEHYQRQCPECEKWFRADENPGFFLCSECSARRDEAEGGAAVHPSDEAIDQEMKKSGCGGSAMLALALSSGLAWCLARVLSA